MEDGEHTVLTWKEKTMRSDKYKKNGRKKSKGISTKTLVVILILAVLVAVGFIIYNHIQGGGYKDEDSFKNFANEQFSNIEVSSIDNVNASEKYNYREKGSVAWKLPETGLKMVDGQVAEIKTHIKQIIAKNNRKDFKNSDTNIVKTAYITGFSGYESKKETRSLLIKTVKFVQMDGKKMEKAGEMVFPINYTKEDGIPVTAMMVFENDYREGLSKYIGEQLKKDYSEVLKEGYKKFIDPMTQNFDNFILNDNTAEFVYNSDDITTATDAVVVKVSEKDVDGIFRDKINPRVLDPSKPMVALTFDDGPASGKTEKLLDALAKNGSKATFFELGKNIEYMEDADKVLKRMLADGNELGSHSYDHPNLYTLSDQQIREQIDKTNKAIKDATGQLPTVYRPPYGNGDDRITKMFNVPGALWTVDTLDWSSRNADSVISIVKNSGDLDGKVILMHSIYDSSVEAAEYLIPWMKSQGYQLVTVSELLTYKYNQNPTDVKFYGYGYFSGPTN